MDLANPETRRVEKKDPEENSEQARAGSKETSQDYADKL